MVETIRKKSSRFTIIYHNVQSLPAHINDITADPIYINCDVLALLEIWLKKLDRAPLIDNYTPYSLCARSTERSGGTIIYAKKDNDLITKIETLKNKHLK